MLLPWLAVLAWMAVILAFSSDLFAGPQTGGWFAALSQMLMIDMDARWFAMIHAIVRKAAHFVEYAILALLVERALRTPAVRPLRRAAYAVLWAVGWAALDETLQSASRVRVGSPWDVLLDGSGALCAMLARVAARR